MQEDSICKLGEKVLMFAYGKRAVTGFETANAAGRQTNIVRLLLKNNNNNNLFLVLFIYFLWKSLKKSFFLSFSY